MKIGFIGCGNMGGALAKAVAKAVSPRDILISDTDEKKRAAFAEETGVGCGSGAEVAAAADWLFLAVKPQVLPAVLTELKPVLATRKDRFVLVSMAAGVTTGRILSLAGDLPLIRIMPNLPVSVGEGMILFTTVGVTAEERETFCALLKEAGRLTELDEKLIDAGTALSGCGPAFVCLLAEALADGGVQCGLPRDKALLLAEQTLFGTAAVLLKNGTHPGVLKDAVCSPGGSTIAGVQALEEGAFRADAANAVLAAYRKTQELGK